MSLLAKGIEAGSLAVGAGSLLRIAQGAPAVTGGAWSIDAIVQGGALALLAAVLWYLGAKVWPSHQAHVAEEFRLMRDWMDKREAASNAAHRTEIELIAAKMENLQCPILHAQSVNGLAPGVRQAIEEAKAHGGRLS
jgi:hypothetical protein